MPPIGKFIKSKKTGRIGITYDDGKTVEVLEDNTKFIQSQKTGNWGLTRDNGATVEVLDNFDGSGVEREYLYQKTPQQQPTPQGTLPPPPTSNQPDYFSMKNVLPQGGKSENSNSSVKKVMYATRPATKKELESGAVGEGEELVGSNVVSRFYEVPTDFTPLQVKSKSGMPSPQKQVAPPPAKKLVKKKTEKAIPENLKILGANSENVTDENGVTTIHDNQYLPKYDPIWEAVIKDKNNSAAAGIYNTLVGSVGRLAGGVGYLAETATNLGKKAVARLAGVGDEADVAINVMNNPEEVRKAGVGAVEQLRSSASSRENEQARSQFDIRNGITADNIKAIGFQLPSQLLDMGFGALTAGGSFFAQAVNDSAKELDENPNAKKLGDAEKLGYIFTQATVQAALEKVPLDKLLKGTKLTNVVTKKIASEIIEDFAKRGVKATAKDIEQAAIKKASSFATNLKRTGTGAAKGFGLEGITEAGQSVGSDAIKLLTNKATGQQVFDEKDITANMLSNAINSGVQGGVVGGVFGGGAGRLSNTNKAIRQEISKATSQEDIAKIQQDINEQFEAGNITEEEAQKANIKIGQYAEIAGKIPAEITPEKKYAIIGGIEQREGLKSDIEKLQNDMSFVDPAFHGEMKSQLDLLQGKLEQVNDYINELVTDEKTKYIEKEGKYFKVDANGEVPITKSHYDMGKLVQENPKEEAPSYKVNGIEVTAEEAKNAIDTGGTQTKIEITNDPELQKYFNEKGTRVVNTETKGTPEEITQPIELNPEITTPNEEVKTKEIIQQQGVEGVGKSNKPISTETQSSTTVELIEGGKGTETTEEVVGVDEKGGNAADTKNIFGITNKEFGDLQEKYPNSIFVKKGKGNGVIYIQEDGKVGEFKDEVAANKYAMDNGKKLTYIEPDTAETKKENTQQTPQPKKVVDTKVEEVGERPFKEEKTQKTILNDNNGENKGVENPLNEQTDTSKVEEGSVVGGDVPKEFTAKGKNKVVDNDGNPIVLYHGTHKDFTGFDPNFDYENIPSNIGQVRDYETPYGVVFLTDNADRTKSYGGKTVSVIIRAKKVLKIDAGSKSPDRFFDDDYNGENKIWTKFEEGGYDAIEISGETPKHGKVKTYITFPEQIKLIKETPKEETPIPKKETTEQVVEVKETTPEVKEQNPIKEETKVGDKEKKSLTELASEVEKVGVNKAIANWLRSKKLNSGGLKSQLVPTFGIPEKLANAAIDKIAAEIEKGTKLGNAIAKVMNWVDSHMGGKKWDKGAFAKHITEVQKININGKEEVVKRDDTKETAQLINGFYSGLEQSILDTKQDSLPAKEWAKKLNSEEAKWTGVTDFINSKQGNISKKEIQQYLKDNRIQVVEVVKGSYSKEVDDLYKKLEAKNKGREFDDWDVKDQDEWMAKRGEPQETKFSQYQLEGQKENYKEVLVTLPEKLVDPEIAGKRYYDNFLRKGGDKAWEELSNKEKADITVKVPDFGKKEGAKFKSTHFEEPNILVHLRMNTRTDAEGKKVLFLEEVQSDFAKSFKMDKEALSNYIDKNDAKVIEAFKKKGLLKVICP